MRGRAITVLVLAILLHSAAWIGVLLDVPLLRAWFYDLAWWPYILAVDSVVYLRRGRSLLWSRPRTFAFAALWSAAFWLFFEVVNFRLANWYYVGIPKDWIARWPGVFLSFATVLPGLMETADLLESLGIPRTLRTRPFSIGPRASAWLALTGALFLALPLAFPRYAYPLIWGAVVLLAEAFLVRRGRSPGAHGLLASLARGDATLVVRWLAAGLVCGLVWEGFNHFATARWIYTVPYFEDTKLFEMPLFGFVGFPPFALECYSFLRVLVDLRWIPEWEGEREPHVERAPAPSALPALACATLVSIAAIAGVQRYTLRSVLPDLRDVPGLDDAARARLSAAGIRSLGALVRAARDATPSSALSALSASDRAELARWAAAAELLELRGMGARGRAWLASVGVEDVRALAASDWEGLAELLAGSGRGPEPPPSAAEVKVWLRGARAHARRPSPLD